MEHTTKGTSQAKAGKDDRIRYIEELRSQEEYPEGDAWISLTDAARITRTSEAMARRWVTSGRLPVKKEAVGIPPRTRLVRISDVAQIRPIVDPTAAITGDVRKLDLPSIPRQQQAIMEDHQQLRVQAQALHITVGEVSQTLQSLEERLQTWGNDLQEAFTQQLHGLFHQLVGQMNDLNELLEIERGKLEEFTTCVNTSQRQVQEAQRELAMRLINQDQAQSRHLDEITKRLTGELEGISIRWQEMMARLGTLTTVYEEHRQVLTRHTDQIGQVCDQAQRLEAEMRQQLALTTASLQAQLAVQQEQFTHQVESIAVKAEAATATALSSQQSAAAQEHRINELERQLKEEREARRVLSQQLQTVVQSKAKARCARATEK